MTAGTRLMLLRMILFTVFLGLASLVSFVLHHVLERLWILSLAVTFLTFFYHFAMRLLVGEVVTFLFRKREFPSTRLGFRLLGFEEKLYERLKVKEWKGRVITAKPEQFDLSVVKPEELLHSVMQAELVHRVIMLLSFVPLLFILSFGEPLVFIATSLLASLLDGVFVVVQRYNRPRVLKIMALQEKRKGR